MKRTRPKEIQVAAEADPVNALLRAIGKEMVATLEQPSGDLEEDLAAVGQFPPVTSLN